MSFDPLLARVDFGDCDTDAIYLPVYKPKPGNDDDGQPVAPKRFMYPPIYSHRLRGMSIQYEELAICVKELNDTIQQEYARLHSQVFRARGFLPVPFFMLITFITANQFTCPGSPVATIAGMSAASVFIFAIIGIVQTCMALCGGGGLRKTEEEDMFHNPEAPMTLRIKEKLAELGSRYRVTLDLVSAIHVVDKIEPGRQFMTCDEAQQRKTEWNPRNGYYEFPSEWGKRHAVHCIVLRRYAPASPPAPAPIWGPEAAATITVANSSKRCCSAFEVDSCDPEFTQGIVDLNCTMKKLCAKTAIIMIPMCFIFLGGGMFILLGLPLVMLGNQCPDVRSVKPWLVQVGITLVWMAAVFIFGKAASNLDALDDLTKKASALNRDNKDMEINLGVELSLRRYRSKGDNTIMQIKNEPVLYFTRRT